MSKNFLKEIRQRRNIKQNDLADRINVKKQALSAFEKGSASISKEKIEQIARIMGVSYEEIINGEAVDKGVAFDKELLKKATKIAYDYFQEKLDNRRFTNIVTEIYDLLYKFENNKNIDADYFYNFLEEIQDKEKAIECFVNSEYFSLKTKKIALRI